MRRIINRVTNKINKEMRRIKNKRTRYYYAACSAGWVKHKKSVIASTDDYFDPYICDNNRMYVSNRSRKSIVSFSANNPYELTNERIVLESGRLGSWEEDVNRACVLKVGDKWIMWYTGQNETRSCIGVAFSSDGYTFTKYDKNPVLQPRENYEGTSVMNPCVMWDSEEQVFKMWYSCGEKYEPDNISYAVSCDGIEWKKYKNNPVLTRGNEKYDCFKVGGCDVVKNNGRYYMFYIGYENIDNARICMAVSVDGINEWVRYINNPIISPTKKGWDKDAVYKPAVNLRDGHLLMWYNGRKGDRETLGIATNEYVTDWMK